MNSTARNKALTLARAAARFIRSGLVAMKIDILMAKIGPALSGYRVMAKLLPTHESYRPDQERQINRKGIRLKLRPSDYTHWLSYFGLEEKQRLSLCSLVSPGDVVFDVGTNLGEVLLQLARAAGPYGRVFGFEPNPETFWLAQENLALNPWAKAEVFQLGLGDREETLNLGSRAEANSGADCVMRGTLDGHAIRVVPLDQFVAEKEIKRLDLIKIDVEGFEQHVLRGASNTIAKHRPTLFLELCDHNLRRQSETASNMVRWLEERGYLIEEALTRKPVNAGDDFGGCFLDIIATPDPIRWS